MELTFMFWTIIGIALTIGIALGTYFWHWIPERSRGAKKRCRIVYDDFLIGKVSKVIKEVEEVNPLYFSYSPLDKSEEQKLKPLLLKSTKDCLDRLSKVSEDYTDMLKIAEDRINGKLRMLLGKYYKGINKNIQEKISTHLGINRDVVTSLERYFSQLTNHLIKAKVKKEDISFDWFKSLSGYGNYDWRVKLNEMLRDAGKSLESFFQSLNHQLKEEASIRFLRKYQNVYLKEAEEAKKKLEKDAKKLKSKWRFVYGIGDEQMLEDLKDKIMIQEEDSLRGRNF